MALLALTEVPDEGETQQISNCEAVGLEEPCLQSCLFGYRVLLSCQAWLLGVQDRFEGLSEIQNAGEGTLSFFDVRI